MLGAAAQSDAELLRMIRPANGADTQGRAGQVRRRRARTRSPHLERAGTALLVFAIVGSALAFGAQATSALVVVSVASAGAALLLGPTTTPRGTWLLLALASYTSIQLVPMPQAWLAVLSPESAAIWSGAQRLLGTEGRFAPLTVDPAGTSLEALKWFAYACLFSAASGVRVRRGPAALALLVFSAAIIVCVVTLAHGILDLPRIYGSYRPVESSQWLRGPFVNGNNLAGYLNLGIFAGVGIWLSPARKLPPWPFALGVPLMAVQVLLSGSRGGIAALVLGALLLGYFTVRQRQLAPKRVALGGATALALTLGAALLVGGKRFWQTIGDLETSAKIEAWRWTLELVRDFPVFGVGRGAFETAFAPYRKPFERNWTMVFPHAENFPLEWAADWGVPVAVAALGGFTLLLMRPYSRATREPLTGALVAGLSVFLLQNLVDLGLEIFGIAALAFLVFAALAEPRDTTPRVRNLGTFVACAGVLGALGLVLVRGATVVHIERDTAARAYSQWVRAGSAEPAAFLARIRRSIENHPAEAYFPLIGSIVLSKTGGEELHWLGRALERAPLDAQVHLRLADIMLSRRARRQALMHLRLAALYDVKVRDHALAKAAPLMRSAGDLSSTFPRDLPAGALLSELCPKTAGEMRVLCWREVLGRDAEDAAARRALASALLDSLESATAPCARDSAACHAELDRNVAAAAKTRDDWRVGELRARQISVNGDPARAAALLLEQCPATNEAVSCCERAFELARRARDLSSLGAAADRFAAVLCNEPSRCALVHERIARAYAELGAWTLAQRHFTAAANESPSIDRWLVSADAAARAGSRTLVYVAFDRARREGDLNAEQRNRVLTIETLLANAQPR
jgi:hypothetical protein